MVPQFHTQLQLIEYTTDHWYLNEPLKYTTLHFGVPWKIIVPEKRFPTDLASVPHILRPIIKRGGTHKAAVIHDWLTYRNPHFNNKGLDGISRRDADKIFREALIVSDVPMWKVSVMFAGVRAYSFFKRT